MFAMITDDKPTSENLSADRPRPMLPKNHPASSKTQELNRAKAPLYGPDAL
jgi:hypothetical protein